MGALAATACLLALLIGCAAPGRGNVFVDPHTGDPAGGDDTAVDLVPDGPDEGAAPWLFGLDAIVPIDITLAPGSYDSLAADPTTYVAASITIDGTRLDDVALRIKGKLGSYRPITSKAAFRMDLDRTVDGQDYHGLKALTLNNMVNDYSFVHEVVSYDLYPRLGVPAPRVGYAWVTVDGVDFGLYANIETQDDVWLDRVYDEPDGNLYEADYILYDDGSYTLLDFNEATQDYFSLEEGDDVGFSDLHAVTAAVTSSWGTEAFYETVGEVVDWDAFFYYWAVELWVGQWDGYNYNLNNYKVYFNPASGKLEMLPWGHDWTFFDWRTWTGPYSVLGYGCLAHAQCKADFLVVLDEVNDTADAADVPALVDEASALIDQAIQDDPRKEVGYSDAISYQGAVRTWAGVRSDVLRATFGIADPEVSVTEVAEGEVSLLDEEGDIHFSGEVLAAWNMGGADLTVGGVTFTQQSPYGYSYAYNVPDFGSDDALETLAYTCAYNPSVPMALTVPVTSGEALEVQLVFFETYYSTQGYRKVDVTIEGRTVVSGLDMSTNTNRAGVLYTWAGTAEGDTLDIGLTGVSSDATPLINGVLVTRPSGRVLEP